MKKNGFTLIELLVVITIMSILTIITVAQFVTAQRRSRDVARKADLNSLSKALLVYYADYGIFPESENGKLSIGGDEIDWGGEFVDDEDYVYMKVVPQENYEGFGQPTYCYVANGDPPSQFALFSGLENEEDSDYGVFSPSDCADDYNFAVVSPNATASDF